MLRFRAPDEGVTVVDDVVRGEVSFANDSIEDFVLLRGNGTPMFLLANVVDDIEMRIVARRAGRGAPSQHTQAADALARTRRTPRRCGHTCRCS